LRWAMRCALRWTMRSATTGSKMTDRPKYWDDTKREIIASDLFVSAAQFFSMGLPDPAFLIKHLLPDEGIVIMGGDPGSGKSWIAFELIRAALTGTSWMGRSAPAADGHSVNVALLNFDQSSRELQRRLKKLNIPGTEHLFLHTIGVRGRPEAKDIALKLPHAVPAMINLFQHRAIRLAVIDSMRQAHEEDENDSRAMGEVMAALRAVATECRCLIVLIQHLTKSSKAIRGSGEINAALDATMFVSGARRQGVVRGTISYGKTRGWTIPGSKERWGYEIKDESETTLVRFTEPVPGLDEVESALALVLQALSAGAHEPTAIKEVLGGKLNRHEIATAVRLGMRRGKIMKARGAGSGSRRIALKEE